MTDSVRVGIKSALADFCLRPGADMNGSQCSPTLLNY